MKHAFKKIMAFALTLAMILSILPSAFAANVSDFTDVEEGKWYYEYIEYVCDMDYMNGVADKTFDPNGTCTRAMAATVIYRLAGEPAVTEPASFTDLTQNWYKNAIAWAEKEKVVNGVGNNKFDPNGKLTREQLVTMIWRYAGSPKVEEDYLKDFPDASQIGAFAKDAFNWAISKKIIGGDNGKLVPKGNATRAQFAKIITVFDKLEACTTHDWGEGVVTKAATCTEEGIMTYTCKICGETKTEVIPVIDHAYVDGVCTVCGDKLASDDEIVIYYTNDVHTYIDGALSYDSIADLKTQTAKVAKGVLLVDAGDHVQGTAFGSMDKGAKIVEMMNAAGYDASAIGNHEFDYGMARALEIIEQADYDYLSCNFYEEANGVPGKNVTDAYKIYTVGGKKIAVIGITTPESFTKSTPKYFQDANGNYIYGIAGGDDGAALYASVQAAIDKAKAETPDFIIALGHLGVDASSKPWTSEEVIANTTGLDAFIDGHSHSTVESKTVKDKGGNDVVLTQTGSYFDAIGKMTIKGDAITTELISSYGCSDATTKGIKDAWIKSVNDQLGEVIGKAAVTLDNYDKDGNRLVRKQETNTGDFAADALYYLFDVTEGLDVDCAIMNGGGVRNKAVTGDISYLTCKSIHTFGNVACLQTVTGQQILDALEWGARDVGNAECGGFLQVSGIEYEIHSYIASTVQKDEKGVWTAGPTGEYRVKNVKIGGEPIDLKANYNLAGYNYTLRDLGDGFAMFDGAVNVKDYVMEDYMVLANYVKSFPVVGELPTIGADSIYKDVNGAGRIKVVSEKPDGGEAFVLSNELKDGDEVVIYNAGSGNAFSSVPNGYYVSGVAVTPADNKIATTDATIIWTVKKNADGTYSFKQGENTIMTGVSGTYANVYFTGEYAPNWNIKLCNADNASYYISSATETTTYGPVYLEWYAKQTAFSAYSTNSISEEAFGFQFFVKGGGGFTPPPPPDFEDKVFEKVTAEPADWEGTYIIAYEIDATNAAVFNGSTDADGNNVAATIADGKITISTEHAVVFEASGDGYTFKAKGGYLSGKLSSGAPANGITFNASPVVGSLSWDAEKGAIITSAETTVFRVNNGLQYGSETEYYNNWFRFFKSGSSVKTPIALYKMTGETPIECIHELVKVDAVAATCTAEGNIEYWKCSKCNKCFSDAAGATEITLASTVTEMIDHVDADDNDLCDVCGADLSTPVGDDFVLASEIKDGDVVVIYNAGNGMAVPAAILSNYYLSGVAITPTGDTISTTDTSIIWTVTKNADNSYTFTNGTNVLSINWNASTSKTSISLDGANPKLTLEVCNAENHSYYVYSATQTGKYEHIYLEWFATYSDFSAYDTGVAKLTEKDFGFQFYVKGEGGDDPACEHTALTATEAAAATCTAAGNLAYWKCNDCGKYFSDAAAETPTTLAAATVAALGHDWDDGEVTTPATETTAGEKTFHCSRCDEVKTEVIPATGSGGDDVYAKVTSDLTDYSGDYLIAYTLDTTTYVYNGRDEANVFVTAPVEEDEITFAEGMAVVRIAKVEGGYSLQIIGGPNNEKYVAAKGGTGGNGSVFVDSPAVTTISVAAGEATILQNEWTFRFNKTTGELRFRYYKPTSTSMPLVNLYKLVEG